MITIRMHPKPYPRPPIAATESDPLIPARRHLDGAKFAPFPIALAIDFERETDRLSGVMSEMHTPAIEA